MPGQVVLRSGKVAEAESKVLRRLVCCKAPPACCLNKANPSRRLGSCTKGVRGYRYSKNALKHCSTTWSRVLFRRANSRCRFLHLVTAEISFATAELAKEKSRVAVGDSPAAAAPNCEVGSQDVTDDVDGLANVAVTLPARPPNGGCGCGNSRRPEKVETDSRGMEDPALFFDLGPRFARGMSNAHLAPLSRQWVQVPAAVSKSHFALLVNCME